MRDLYAVEIRLPAEFKVSIHPDGRTFGPPYTLRLAAEVEADEFENMLEGLARALAAGADIMGRDE